VVLIGAGGAARAIGFSLISQGARVTILNRSIDRGEALAKDLGAGFQPLDDQRLGDCDILVNTTSVGMTPCIDAMPIEPGVLHKHMVVMDIVYNPLKTKLLETAQKMGCTVVDGVAMFVNQGAFQFELWTGKPAPIQVMRQSVLDALGSAEKSGP